MHLFSCCIRLLSPRYLMFGTALQQMKILLGRWKFHHSHGWMMGDDEKQESAGANRRARGCFELHSANGSKTMLFSFQ